MKCFIFTQMIVKFTSLLKYCFSVLVQSFCLKRVSFSQKFTLLEIYSEDSQHKRVSVAPLDVKKVHKVVQSFLVCILCPTYVHNLHCNLSLSRQATFYISNPNCVIQGIIFPHSMEARFLLLQHYFNYLMARLINLPIKIAGLLFRCIYCLICYYFSCYM